MDAYQLNPTEVRVLGALAEKQALTPDTYPLTLNTLTSACNQLTSREPVMQLSEHDILTALDSLMAQKLVAERTPAGGRVSKYEHRMFYVWNIDGARKAALVQLMLRGAQTSAEIRSRSGRLYTFSGLEEVETALEALADKYPPMVQKLARQPGEREARWVHLLSGDIPQVATMAATESADPGLAARVEALEKQVEAMKEQIATLEDLLTK